VPRPEPDKESSSVVGVSWGTFDKWFSEVWQPGEHMALIGPTGQGKSTFACRLLMRRKYALAIDPKGEDDTLTDSGFLRLRSWPPPRNIREDIEKGKGAHLVVGGGVRSVADFDKLKELVGQVLDAAYVEGGWTVFLDELQVASQMFGHSLKVQRNLISARARGVSMMTAYQAPAWVPSAASRQARWLVAWPTRDEDVIKSIAAKCGRPWQEVKAVLHGLPDFHVMVVGTNPRDPIVVTHCPKL